MGIQIADHLIKHMIEVLEGHIEMSSDYISDEVDLVGEDSTTEQIRELIDGVKSLIEDHQSLAALRSIQPEFKTAQGNTLVASIALFNGGWYQECLEDLRNLLASKLGLYLEGDL